MTKLKITKVISVIITLLLLTTFLYAQKTEISLNTYSGLFYFRGNGTTTNSSIDFNPLVSPETATANPYGKKSEFSYALELQVQRILKNKIILGTAISYEALTSKLNITSLNEYGFIYYHYPATGKTTLKNTFFTVNPFTGYRFIFHKITINILAGSDFAFCLKSKEVGKASTNNKDYSTVENNKPKPYIDYRPRIQIKTQINKIGFIAGYSIGLTNYQYLNNTEAFTRFLRLGLSYQIH